MSLFGLWVILFSVFEHPPVARNYSVSTKYPLLGLQIWLDQVRGSKVRGCDHPLFLLFSRVFLGWGRGDVQYTSSCVGLGLLL